jgi:DNA-binding NarL/FixJ family response regulator
LEPIRILLVDMPRMLREIVSETVSNQPDMRVVAERAEHSSMPSAASESGAQVVIVGSDGPDVEDGCERFALQRPDVGVLALSADGRQTVLYELRPHRVSLGDLSPQQLTAAIRRAVQARARVA